MSFYDERSDVSLLNRDAVRKPIQVHPLTYEVLGLAKRLWAASEGAFDIAAAGKLMEWGLLPRQANTHVSAEANTGDIELLPQYHVRFRRALSIDLGGIAKGFAIDRAVDRLRRAGVGSGAVNAGGDLRVFGPDPELIALDLPHHLGDRPLVELSEGSLASSCGTNKIRLQKGRRVGPHVCGQTRTPASTERFVCVAAEDCVVADALTKVVMSSGVKAEGVLRQFNAQAHFYERSLGWSALNAPGEARAELQ